MTGIKIAFSGIGGVGGYYGGTLAGFYEKDPHIHIYFLSRGENLQKIRQQGLQIKTSSATHTVHPALATDIPQEIGKVDYLFCTTKSYDLEENIHQLIPVTGPETVIIPLLNGADITEKIQHILPHNEVWYGCVYIGARLTAPGEVTQFTGRNKLWFGHPQGNKEKQKQLLHILNNAHIEAFNPEDIILRIWKKFFLISLSATLTSYYNQSIGQVLEFHRNDYFRLGKELLAVAKGRGITLPEDLIQAVIADQLKMPYQSTTSMHTDFIKGKLTELETLTGYVVRSGQELHISTPLYEMMYHKLKSEE